MRKAYTRRGFIFITGIYYSLFNTGPISGGGGGGGGSYNPWR